MTLTTPQLFLGLTAVHYRDPMLAAEALASTPFEAMKYDPTDLMEAYRSLSPREGQPFGRVLQDCKIAARFGNLSAASKRRSEMADLVRATAPETWAQIVSAIESPEAKMEARHEVSEASNQLAAVKRTAMLPLQCRSSERAAEAFSTLNALLRKPPSADFSLPPFDEIVRLKAELSRLAPEHAKTLQELFARLDNSVAAGRDGADITDLVDKTPPRIWAHIISIFGERGRAAELKKYGIEPTPFNLQLYGLGLSIAEQKIAFDLDGTLIDWVVERTSSPGDHLLTFRIKPGAEALVLGLARTNDLLLYTVREAAQVEKIMEQCPAFQQAFQNLFTYADWIDSMTAILSKGLNRSDELTLFDKKILKLIQVYRDNPLSLAHLKHPELASRQNKPYFEVIIDDSEGLADLLAFVGTGPKQIYLRPSKRFQDSSELRLAADDELFHVARFLAALDEIQSVHIEHADSLAGEPLRQFSVVVKVPIHLDGKLEHLEILRQRWLAQNFSPSSLPS